MISSKDNDFVDKNLAYLYNTKLLRLLIYHSYTIGPTTF